MSGIRSRCCYSFRKRDPETSQSKKGNQWYFGMKAHPRVRVVSRVIKCQFGYRKVRYRGLAKNSAQLLLLLALANLFLARQSLPRHNRRPAGADFRSRSGHGKAG
jgi:IS5 family transposase